MNPYVTNKTTWNKIASLYEAHFMDLDLYNDTYDLFCKELTNDQVNILEIGCGPGNIMRYILSQHPNFKILGTDIAPNMIKLAKQHNPTADFEVLDCREIDTLSNPFDGILCGFCIPYLHKEDCANLIKNSSELLLKNGIFYLSFVEGDYDTSDYQTGSTGDQVFFYYYELPFIEDLLIKNGFEILHLIKKQYNKHDNSPEIHTIILAKRT